jgi:hypothetical protein
MDLKEIVEWLARRNTRICSAKVNRNRYLNGSAIDLSR